MRKLILIVCVLLGAQAAAARPYNPATDGQIFYGAGREYNEFKTTTNSCPEGYILEDRSFHEGRRLVRNNWCTTPRWYHNYRGGEGVLNFMFPIF